MIVQNVDFSAGKCYFIRKIKMPKIKMAADHQDMWSLKSFENVVLLHKTFKVVFYRLGNRDCGGITSVVLNFFESRNNDDKLV